MASRVLLLCGVLALVVFVVADLAAGLQWNGYSFIWKSIGELTAIGAPTRSFATPLFIVQSAVLIAFGAGVWGEAGANTPLRVIAALLVGSGLASLAATIFFPAQAGVRPSPSSAIVISGAAAVILLLGAIGFGAAAFSNWFRFYSIGTLAIFVLLAIVGFVAQAEPHVGLQERVMAYGSLAWVGLLAIVLLGREGASGGAPGLGAGW